MTDTYPVAVTDGSNKTKYYHFRLKRFGLETRDGITWKGRTNKRKMKKIERFADKKHLKYYIDNEYGKRSSNYRKTFFANINPAFGNTYFCAYCGKPVGKEKITVDHLFPVGKVSRDIRLQKRIRWFGIKDVNSAKNLVPACSRCNQAKSTKMGIWLIKGYIGKHQKLWFFRWTVRFLVIAALIYLVFSFISL